MGRVLTLGTLVSRAKTSADMVNAGFVADEEWKAWISEAYAELCRELEEYNPARFETEQTITTTGAGDYALPSDHKSSLGVDWQETSSERRRLQHFSFQARERYTSTTGSTSARAWRVVGANLRLAPTPPTGQTYVHYYITQPTDYSSAADGTSIELFYSAGAKYVQLKAAVQALVKEQTDPRDLERRLGDAYNQLLADIVRDLGLRGYPVSVDRTDGSHAWELGEELW